MESISTFSSPEIISYKELVRYTVLLCMISIKRSDFKKKIVHSPEILTCIREISNVKSLMESFYKCDYRQFFIAFNNIIEELE